MFPSGLEMWSIIYCGLTDNEIRMKSKNKTKKEQEEKYFYINDEAKEMEFSDFVRISSYPHGLILRFGRYHVDEKAFGIFRSIILPFPVAGAMSGIVKEQLEDLVNRGLVIKEKPGESEN
jgi:hypothetical protein